MKQPTVTELPLKKIRDLLLSGIFAVPKIQREFVWDGPKAADLLDSVYQNMPIGTLLVWETYKGNYDLLRQTLHILPAFNKENRYGWFLIDGQQRLSVLHQAFEGLEKQNSAGRPVDFGRICYVLHRDEEAKYPVYFSYRRPVHRKFVVVKNILSREWKRMHRGYTVNELSKLAKCRERLLNYRVPIVKVRSAHLEDVREIFLRTNSQGMKISAADRAFARAATVDLRHLAHEVRRSIDPTFQNLDFNIILQGFAFITPEHDLDLGQRALDNNIVWWNQRIEEEGQSCEFFPMWRRYRIAFGKAVDYLKKNFCVLRPDFLPSENMFPELATFFFHHPAAPDTRQRKEIGKWFWATGLGQRYSGRGYRQNLIADVGFFGKLARGRGVFQFEDLVDPVDVLRTEYGQTSSIASTFLCLLVKNNPCYVENGESIPYGDNVALANRRNRHHIFPRALLLEYGFAPRDCNSLVNICLIVSEENIRFGKKPPALYLKPYWGKSHFGRTMRSHLIPYTRDSELRSTWIAKAFKQFRAKRLPMICDAFENEAGLRLFRRK